MEIFKIVRKHYVILGIRSTRLSTQNYRFSDNIRLFFGLLLYGCSFVSQYVYIFYVASGFMEHMVCICTTAGNVITFVCFVAIAFRMNLLFKAIDNMNVLVNSSKKSSNPSFFDWQMRVLKLQLFDLGCECAKSEALFLKSSQQVEQMCKIIFVLVVKIALQCYMLPNCAVSYGIYLLTDSGSNSFQLPVPFW